MAAQTATATILVLEDEVETSAIIREILEEHGLQVGGPFRTNAHCLAYLAGTRPDAAILDFNVADGTSSLTAARLKEMRIPFMVASGYPKLIARGLEFQSACWLGKPFGEAALLKHLSDLLPRAYRD
ncbi:MAG: histidine kinase [Hyphomicrobiales bacterium]|nr:histidine kinase [Hyphomicrobiales bacterium]